MARPELVEQRPSWPTTLRLEPLTPEQTDILIGHQVESELRERIAHAAGGNPLFITEMLAVASERAEVEVPPTLKALLAMRLDQLDDVERRVLERGSIEGEVFHRGAVQALTPEETQVTPRLAALVRRQLIRPDRAQLAGDDGYRFCHLLIRDAAYGVLPKATRADLHARFAAWLDRHGGALVERDEIVGYHLEQAAGYQEELGQDNSELSLSAGERLGVAGERAYWRGDWKTAVGLLERALSLTRPHRLDIRREAALVDALYWIDVVRSVAVAVPAAERAVAAGDEVGAALALTVAASARLRLGECSAAEVERLAREALPLLEAAGDDDGFFHVCSALVWIANTRQRFEDWAEAMEAAMRHARRAGHPIHGVAVLSLGVALAEGPRPTDEALATLDGVLAEQPYAAGGHLLRGQLLAMLDRIDEAWAVALPAEERLRALGLRSGGAWLAEIARLSGDYGRAAEYLRDACDALEAIGNTGELSSYAPELGRMLCILGRHDEAEPLASQGRELGTSDDVMTQQLWRQAQALVESSRGRHDRAESLAREALAFSQRSDNLFRQGDVLSDLAEVLESAGRHEEAVAALRLALDLYERKRAIPLARRSRERLAALQDSAD
jgi:tetratricopeptide (TPR) repeat protein